MTIELSKEMICVGLAVLLLLVIVIVFLTKKDEKFKLEKTNAEVAKVCAISAATLQKCLKRIDSWRPVLFKD